MFAAHLDIAAFFPSHDPQWLVDELPLRSDVAEHGVIGRHLKVEIDQTTAVKKIIHHNDLSLQHLKTLARQGLPQGLVTSSLIGMMTIARLNWHDMPGVALFNLADDFLILAQSEAALGMAKARLEKAVAEHPGGHFDIRLKRFGPLTKGIDFLGHSLRIVDGVLRVSPTYENLSHLTEKLLHLESQIYGKTGYAFEKDSWEAYHFAARYVATVQGWLSAHRACDDLETRWAVLFIDNMKETLALLGVSMDYAKSYIQPWMKWKHVHS